MTKPEIFLSMLLIILIIYFDFTIISKNILIKIKTKSEVILNVFRLVKKLQNLSFEAEKRYINKNIDQIISNIYNKYKKSIEDKDALASSVIYKHLKKIIDSENFNIIIKSTKSDNLDISIYILSENKNRKTGNMFFILDFTNRDKGKKIFYSDDSLGKYKFCITLFIIFSNYNKLKEIESILNKIVNNRLSDDEEYKVFYNWSNFDIFTDENKCVCNNFFIVNKDISVYEVNENE